MSKTVAPPRSKNLLGKAVVLWRAMRGLFLTPSGEGITFESKGDVLSGRKVLLLETGPDRVWKSVWQNIIFDPPHRSMDDVRSGDTASFYTDIAHGYGQYWCHMTVQCGEVIPGQRAHFRILKIDGTADSRMSAISNEYIVEPEARGTRLTICVTDDQAGATVMFRNFMIMSITNDAKRIVKNLSPPSGGPLGSGHKPRPQAPVRKSAVSRA